MTIDRRQSKLAMERHDFITVEQCARLVLTFVQRELDHREQAKREARWYRRLARWCKRPIQW